MPHVHAEVIICLDRIECASRVLLYVQDAMPGDDLGQEARAVALIELRAALKSLDEYRGSAPFDARAALEEIRKQHTSGAW